MNPFSFLNYSLLGNSIESYLWFLAIIAGGFALKNWLSCQISRLAFRLFQKQTPEIRVNHFVDLLNKPLEALFTVLIIYFAFDRLEFPSAWNLVPKDQTGFRLIVFRLFDGAIAATCFWIIIRFVDFIALIFSEKAKKTTSKADDQLVPFVKEAVKVVIASVGFFVILGVTFHLDVISLVTGLGIGGLAIALAARETLENLFGSFTIFLDKPFVAGDSVKVGSVEGKVERVGFRSTRIRAVDKMMVIVPNKRMIDAELINDTDRIIRRSSFILSLNYDTTEEQLKKILLDIRSILNDNSNLEHGNEVVRFRNFGQTGLEILIIFFVMTTEMSEFLGVQEEINFQIMSIVKKHHASFAIAGTIKNDVTGQPSFKTIVPGLNKPV